jgi:hypothetical protein
MSNKLGKIWKGVVMAYLKFYFGICLEGLRKNGKKKKNQPE